MVTTRFCSFTILAVCLRCLSIPEQCVLLEDCSHVPESFAAVSTGTAFGSLRKVYRVADGGFLRGRFNPLYEPSRKLDAWLRCEAADWRDLREAENMTDRDATISDIASQALSVILTADDLNIAARRRATNHCCPASCLSEFL